MGYIAVDIPHFIFVLFNLFVCSIQALTIYEIVQIVMILGSTYLTRIVSQIACVRERNLTPAPVYNTQGERPHVPHVLHHLKGELTSMAFKHHMTI